jgi:hypothetical protein
LVKEIEAIAQSPCKEHVLIIDDIRLFDTFDWDFVSKDSVLEAIYKINPNYKLAYADGEETGELPNDILIASVFI